MLLVRRPLKNDYPDHEEDKGSDSCDTENVDRGGI
jgi:hypothetical protein